MYSRVTLFALDTLRFELEAAIERFNEVVLPALLEQPGYEGVYVLVNPDGNGLVLSLWETAEHAAAGLRSGFYSAQLETFVTLFRAPPGREGYEVVLADTPAFAPD
jgi:heme-degrading monooxygenase HmoA